MPTYEYTCSVCGKPFELSATITQYSKGLKPACPRCRATKSIRRFTSVNVKTRSKTGAY